MKKIILLLLPLHVFLLASSQNFTISMNQPQTLEAFAGDTAIIEQGESVVLGGNPTAQYGNGNYIYLWSPSTWLDDNTVANPTAIPNETITYYLTVTDENDCTAYSEVLVSVEPSNIHQAFYSDLSVLPNPNNGIFELEGLVISELSIIKIFDLNGKIIYTDELKPSLNIHTIDISNNSRGVYFLKIIQSNIVYNEKIIIN